MPTRGKIESPNAQRPAFPESFLLVMGAFWARHLIWAPSLEVGRVLLDANNSMTYIDALYPFTLSLAGIHELFYLCYYHHILSRLKTATEQLPSYSMNRK